MEPDFSGYATKAGLKCSDGRTIKPEAFQHMNGKQVPLVWQHGHANVENVLGHVMLEARPDGVYAQAFTNDTKQGKIALALVQHGDIKKFSIYANKLVERAKQVYHGDIREVSLVLAGANPGAVIDHVRIQHDDGEIEELEDAAIIHTDLDIELPASEGDAIEHAEQTIKDVYDTLTEDQKRVVSFLVGQAIENAVAQHSDESEDDQAKDDKSESKDDKEGSTEVAHNVFDKTDDKKTDERHELTHDDMKEIAALSIRAGSMKAGVEEYALKHGITNIETLFPTAKLLENRPQWNKRNTEWVDGVISGVSHSPFSRVKTLVADLTQDEARARGYIKGNFKKEEWFSVTGRTTGPTTIYKKQKLDRDDVIDIVDFDVVAWMKEEMRLMLMEEIARAILISDGRDPSDPDKIKDPVGATDGLGLRSILNDHELFVTTVYSNLDDASSSYMEFLDDMELNRRWYRGSGAPTFYTTEYHLSRMLLMRDETGSNRRLFSSVQELATTMRVRNIVTVEVMETLPDVIGILVNLSDYNIGADRGGEVSLFDDFDIDYNQLKYLIETRASGALTKIKSAVVYRKTTGTNVLVAPTTPTFVASTGVITIPTKTGVVYKDTSATGSTLTAGAQTALSAGATKHVVAVPASGYYFSTNAEDEWDFKRPSA